MIINYSSVCDIGKTREVNQDSVLSFTDSENEISLFVVADGMGGHKDGELASQELVNRAESWIINCNPDDYDNDFNQMFSSLQNVVKDANEYIYTNYNEGQICGSTIIALFIYRNQYGFISVGDSHLYRIKNGKMRQLNVDDVWQNQPEIKNNLSYNEQMTDKNFGKLTNAVGINERLVFSAETDELKNGDAFLLCSDGLYKHFNDRLIKRYVLLVRHLGIKKVAPMLKDRVYEHGADDNISIIFASVRSRKPLFSRRG